MKIRISKLRKEDIKQYRIEQFLFKMIKESYNLDYVPEYHYDIKDLYEYYIKPEKNSFYIAVDEDTNKIIATAGIRCYDRKKSVRNRKYSKDTTASIYRVFVEKEYRHQKIATSLIRKIEEFCKNNDYREIYLHTQRPSYGALPFWLSQEFKIIDDTKDEMGTIHMEKVLLKELLHITSLKDTEETIKI